MRWDLHLLHKEGHFRLLSLILSQVHCKTGSLWGQLQHAYFCSFFISYCINIKGESWWDLRGEMLPVRGEVFMGCTTRLPVLQWGQCIGKERERRRRVEVDWGAGSQPTQGQRVYWACSLMAVRSTEGEGGFHSTEWGAKYMTVGTGWISCWSKRGNLCETIWKRCKKQWAENRGVERDEKEGLFELIINMM